MSQPRILFVDDEPMVLDSMRRALGTRYEIATAHSGPAALGLIGREGPFDVVLSDKRMPRMDGLEFLRIAHSQLPDARFILMTGNQDLETTREALELGAVQMVLVKPCTREEIVAAIEGVLATAVVTA